VDLDRNIYVADYNTGRLQKFDSQGQFIYQILVDPGRNGTWIISDLAIDTENRLYVVRVGDLLIYDGTNGSLISSINGQDMDAFFQSIAIDPSNRLYAVSTTASDNSLFIFDSSDDLLQFDEFVSQVNPGDPAMDLTIAVDGIGNSYVLSTFGRQVYLYNRFGEFVDRFGSINEESDSFWTASGIAVDGNQRIYMPNLSDIQIFDNNGFPMSTIMIKPGTGALRDLVIDSEGFMYLVTGNGKVFKFPPFKQ
jgi:DNA-binding beta-propeller fold protein YncE